MTTRDESRTVHHERIGTTPVKFKGNRSGSERFITGLEWYLEANTEVYDTKEKILSLVYGLCKGKAGLWVQPYMRNTLDAKYEANKPWTKNLHSQAGSVWSFDSDSEEEDEEAARRSFFTDSDYLIKNINNFVVKFKEIWFPADPQADASNEIEKMAQGSLTVSEHASKFNMVAMQTGYGKPNLRERFRRGIRDDISNVISAWDRNMSTFDKLKNAVIKAEHQKEELAPRRKNTQGVAPMKVDAGTFVCYNCYKEGHTAKECTNPKQPWHQIPFRGKALRKEGRD